MAMSLILSIVAISTLVGSVSSYFTNKQLVNTCFKNKCYVITTGTVTHIGHGLGRSKVVVNNKAFEVHRNANPFFIDSDMKKIEKNDNVTIYSIPSRHDGIIYLTRNSST